LFDGLPLAVGGAGGRQRKLSVFHFRSPAIPTAHSPAGQAFDSS